jgi:hypothetical protein
MKQRGRKSEASLEIAELAPVVARPPAPERLTAEQAAIWTRVIGCESPGFIKESQFGLLANYCVLESASFTASALDLLKISHEMTSIARALRLTNQSRMYPDTAGRKAAAAVERPWQRAG